MATRPVIMTAPMRNARRGGDCGPNNYAGDAADCRANGPTNGCVCQRAHPRAAELLLARCTGRKANQAERQDCDKTLNIVRSSPPRRQAYFTASQP
jgi:hypothetical protein